MVINLASTHVLLDPHGPLQALEGGAAFWSRPEAELDALGRQWMVSEFAFDRDWPNWEMHPEGDELVYLLEGEADLLLSTDSGTQRMPLRAGQAVIVPAKQWHTVQTTQSCRTLHLTRGVGTTLRAAE